MSTKQELQEQASKLQTELEKLNKTISSMKDELPEGFIPFEATANSTCPCHPKDIVLWVTGRYPNGVESNYQKEANRLSWGDSGDKKFHITGYKIVKKYVGPRPMKFSELAVGQTFKWGYRDGDTVQRVNTYVKFSHSTTEKNSVALQDGGGISSLVSFDDDDDCKFYSVELTYKVGPLLVVEQSPQPVEDEFYTLKGHNSFFIDSERYLMGRRPDGQWFSIKESGVRDYNFSSGDGYDRYVKNGGWVKTTPEQAFKL